jgi:uncharacterized membrane protein YdbT with pleckstrin-like domain
LPGPPPRDTVRDMAFPRRLLVEGEELVLDLRPHWIALVGPIGVAVLALAAWAIVAAKYDGAAVLVTLAAALTVIVGYSARKTVDWATSHFVLTSDRVLHRSGLVAKHSMEIPLEHINDVRFSQNVVERMINAGTLTIQSASEQGREVFDNIRHPEEVQKRIYKIGEENKTRMYQGPSAGQRPTAPSVTTELERLADLRAKGILTEEEFQAQKAKVLGT